jgi:hypothetical protein
MGGLIKWFARWAERIALNEDGSAVVASVTEGLDREVVGRVSGRLERFRN